MKKTNLLCYLFIAFSSITLYGQDYYVKGMEELRFYERLNSQIDKRDFKQYDGITGSPYLYPGFKNAEVLTTDSTLYRGKLRYDMFADQMEYKVKGGGIYWLANPERVVSIKIDTLKFIFYPEKKGKDKGTYYELLLDGKCRLLIKKGVLFKDAVQAKPYQDPKPAEFTKRKDLFLLARSNAPIQKIGKKKSVLTYLSDHSQELSAYIKQNQTSFIKAEDLKKLILFYNQLEK